MEVSIEAQAARVLRSLEAKERLVEAALAYVREARREGGYITMACCDLSDDLLDAAAGYEEAAGRTGG